MGQCLYRRNLSHDIMDSQTEISSDSLPNEISALEVLPSFLWSPKESSALDISNDNLMVLSRLKSSPSKSPTLPSRSSSSTFYSDSKQNRCLWRASRSYNSQQIYGKGNWRGSHCRSLSLQHLSRSKSVPWHRKPSRAFSRDLNRNVSSTSILRYQCCPLREREKPQVTVPKFIAGERIGKSDCGKLTLKEPLRLLSNNFSCSLRITDVCFELLYDQSDSMYPAYALTQNKTKNWTQHRSNKVWISGSVTPEADAFTLHPSKLIFSISGVEHGLSRKPGGLLNSRWAGSRDRAWSRDRTSGSVSISLENCKIENTHVSTSSVQTLTSYWFASEGLFLDKTCKTAKDCFQKMIKKRLKHEYIAELVWEFLPESMFKDQAGPAISGDQKNQLNVQQDSFFKSFSVVPISQSILSVSNIDLAVCVFSNTDGNSSCMFLSELNGLFECAETIVPRISSVDSFSNQKAHASSIRSQTPVVDLAQNVNVKNEPHLSNVNYSENKLSNRSVAMSYSKILATELNEFEDRIKVAILDAISSKENLCRYWKVNENERDVLKSWNSKSLKSQGRNEKIMGSMRVVLRPENFRSVDELLSSGLQSESNEYDGEHAVEKDIIRRSVFLGVRPTIDSFSLSPITTDSLRAIEKLD